MSVFNRRTLALALLLLTPAIAEAKQWRLLEPAEIPAAAAQATGFRTGVNLCWLNAYSDDSDPKGTNIRAAPSRNAPVIGTIPQKRAEAGTEIGPEFQVIGSTDGWLLIRQAIWRGYERDEKLLFKGPGWIAAGLVSFSVEDPLLRAEPHMNARTIMELTSAQDAESSWGPDSVIIKRAHRCSGSFVEVDLETPDGRKARGWANGACANQVTTCGGNPSAVEERAGKLVSPK
ncbi:SH3 domain-containing protein [Microvirga sp. ACRRW]|uniref:SH3 domain-containing protein n=1 Tax=Microvirga sp. ACRRW TaxID=2918205 RepID=UPI001EF6AFCC|nr:SH3 domain-containing protein [Microvirga sp. ACRRW]MCG7392148.1 SH3 domain-containing protein [Microvirga sp. ACRRW]